MRGRAREFDLRELNTNTIEKGHRRDLQWTAKARQMKLNYQLQSWGNSDDRTPVIPHRTKSGKQGSKVDGDFSRQNVASDASKTTSCKE